MLSVLYESCFIASPCVVEIFVDAGEFGSALLVKERDDDGDGEPDSETGEEDIEVTEIAREDFVVCAVEQGGDGELEEGDAEESRDHRAFRTI